MSLGSSRCSHHARSVALTLGLSLLLAIAGCGGTSSSTGTGPTSKTLKSITAAPAQASIAVGTTEQFTATATYSDGSTADATQSATWTDSDSKIASITSSGIAKAVAPGSTTVTASLDGISGSATLTVPTPPKTLNSIAVSPASPGILVGATQQFTATASYSDNSTADVTTTVTWTSSNTAVATINTAGLATAVAAGSTTVTATLNGVSSTATLNVSAPAPALASIAVSGAATSIAVGGTDQFTATATYSDGSSQDVTATASWSSSTPSVASISAAGLATAASAGSTTISASLNGVSGSTTLAVTGITSIAVTPASASFAVGGTQQFTATATYSDKTTADVTATATWKSSNTALASISSGGLAKGVAAGSPTISASLAGKTGSVTATVTVAPGNTANVTTWHYDNNRSGLNPNETTLTPANVASNRFGKLFSYLVDGYAYAEPLIMSNVTIKGTTHNVLYVATENDSVYAFDADNGNKTPLWKTSLLQSGESPAGGSIQPYQGITSTPVIDPSTNTIYVVSEQKSGGTANYRLNALDITTGAQKSGSPVTITASVPGTNSTHDSNGMVSLPAGCVQRAALLLSQGSIYIGVGSCHSGWLVSYDAKSLAQTGVFNASPNLDGEGTYGGAGGVWMGSGGPVADSAGNIYISTGNGPWDPSQSAYGDSILKFSPTLQLLNYFTPEDYGYMNCEDSDLASGGLLMVPGSGQVIGGGKMGKLYLVNTANMGHEQAMDAGVVQRVFVEQGISGSQPYASSCTDSDSHGNPLPNGKTWYVGGSNDTNGDTANGINSYEIFGTSAYFNGSIYLGVTPTTTSNPTGVIRRFTYTPGSTSASGQLSADESTPLDLTQQQPENTRGTTPFISANGANDGILWTIDQGQPLQTPDAGGPTKAVLYAYDATNLSDKLYGSNINSGDQAGYGIKFSSPVVANGRVYISTGHDLTTVSNPQGEIDVYGLK
jgi:uncharacterized protein YjdB